MRRYTVDGRGVRSFDDFVAAMNAGFIRPAGGLWNGNLDAFNDYLSWPDDAEYELELLGASEGETLFDVIREIVAANPHVHLMLR